MTASERFWQKVNRRGPNDCWEWTGATSGGYGSFLLEGKTRKAHRISWELANGPIPEGDGAHGTCVCHSCDNPPCVNPAHLWLGSNTENVADRDHKGRHLEGRKTVRGEGSPSAKLTADDVENIRANEHNLTQREQAEIFGVSRGQIHRIITRQKWAHL
jgi:hypothetical protein